MYSKLFCKNENPMLKKQFQFSFCYRWVEVFRRGYCSRHPLSGSNFYDFFFSIRNEKHFIEKCRNIEGTFYIEVFFFRQVFNYVKTIAITLKSDLKRKYREKGLKILAFQIILNYMENTELLYIPNDQVILQPSKRNSLPASSAWIFWFLLVFCKTVNEENSREI